MKRSYAVYQVDAFTKEKLSGNPAGVVLDARGLTDEEMRRIARELNNSETAFILPGKPGEYDVQVRFFTPAKEVPVCGHATIASHYVRAMELGLDSARVVQKCGAGIFAVDVCRENGDYRVVMSQGRAVLGEPLSWEHQDRVLAALGVTRDDLRPGCPMASASVGSPKLMVVLRSLDKLHSLTPDLEALKELSGEIGCSGYLVFTLHPGEEPLVHARMFGPANGVAEDPVTGHGRMFGPANGVAEDPVTGIANGPMGAYLVRNGLIPAEGDEVRFTAVQGEAMGRPGSMEVRVALENGQPGEIQIVGNAVVAFRTTLELDA